MNSRNLIVNSRKVGTGIGSQSVPVRLGLRMSKALAVLLAMLLAQLALAVTGSVPGPGKLMPMYFSGTSCVAEGFAQSTVNSKIVSARLLLGRNGTWETVWSVALPVPNPGKLEIASVEPVILFDSSHFNSGIFLTVKLEVTDNNGVIFTFSGTSPVINQGTLYGLSEFEGPVGIAMGANGCNVVSNRLTDMNHDIPYKVQANWYASDFIEAQNYGTVVYINTHGFPHSLQAELPSAEVVELGFDEEFIYPNTSGGHPMVPPPNQIYESRLLHLGSGLPPNNSGVPKINFAYLDACEVGQGGASNPFSEAFVPPVYPRICTRFSRGCANQALMGWNACYSSAGTRERADRLFELFELSRTADDARDIVALMMDPTQLPEAVLRLWGDYDMRLHGVYTGSTALAPNGWYCGFMSLQ